MNSAANELKLHIALELYVNKRVVEVESLGLECLDIPE